MQRRIMSILLACTLLLVWMQAAQAASYIVAPFKVNGASGYSYLGKAIPPMLSSRLFWQGKYAPSASQDSVLQGNAPAGRAEADKLRKKHNADYVVWGSVTVMGTEASLDVSALDAKGKVWQQAFNAPVNNLLGSVQQASDAISSQLFGRASSASPRQASAMNAAFMMNETDASAGYASPQIRYENMDGDRIRSQMMDFESLGMEVADFDGDGKNEIALLEDKFLRVYQWNNGRLDQLAELQLPFMMRVPLLVRALPDGRRHLLVVTAFDDSGDEPASQIFAYQKGSLSEYSNRVRYYLNVVPMAPSYQPRLIGQKADRSRTVRGDIFDVNLHGKQLSQGSKYTSYPREANVFNIAWLPGSVKNGGDYLVAVGNEENLLVHNRSGKRLAKTDEVYTGTSIGIPATHDMPGMNKRRDSTIVDTSDLTYYYVPMRMLVADPDKSGTPVLIVNKPITTAGKLFKNYRTYPQGEIHALFWDGIGLDLKWKTRRIKGSIVDLGIADANNDGVEDLVVSVNTYPGSLGMGKIRNIVLIYPLSGN